jgi:hypothetical protein
VSNIFAPLVRPYGTLPVLIESGPAVGHTEYMHMLVDIGGFLLCSNDAIDHYGAALPFDINGRVVVSAAAVTRWDQDIPFTASGAVAMVEALEAAHWDQGLTFLDTGHIVTGGVAPDPVEPIWSEIPTQYIYHYELPDTSDVSPYVSDGGEEITSYALIGAPDFFTIDQNGVITAGVGSADAAHVLTVEACNVIGCTTTTMTWDLDTGVVPTWETIPNQQHRINELPKQLNVGPYVYSASGPILSLTLVAPPPGITISNGVITVAAGTVVSSYVLTVRATNGVGASDTTFTWDILEELIAPVWSVIPSKINSSGELPDTHDVSPYVTSNAGVLRNWLLITPPTGFTIDQNGVVTAAAGTALVAHNIVVQVENDIGTTSSSFLWTISDQLLPPQWQTIPGQSDPENLLPTILDVSGSASSNDGPLTGWSLVTPPIGFTISAAGIITVAAGTAVGNYSITVEVSNDTGTTASAPFDWIITLFYVAPVWSTIPAQLNGDDELPTTLDTAPYVTTNSGPLTTWELVTPPSGFSIDAAGVITVAAGTAELEHSVTVRVSNDTGTTDSDPFSWEISDVLAPPSWSTVTDQNTREDDLPEDLDLDLFVTSNDGVLFGWMLVSPPTGFTISSAGLVTAAASLVPGTYNLQSRVSNNSGQSPSNIWDWVVGSFYLPPQWTTIPPQSTEEQLLPAVLDVKPYVSSNNGPLIGWTLVSPPAGWSISNDGIVTAAAWREVGTYQLTVRVTNGSGSSDSASFDWDILEEPLVPQWTTIPARNDRENTLPQNYDISPWVTSNAGVLTGWTLVTPPAGFSINGAGVITAAAGTTVAGHSLTVRVSNDVGQNDATFTWNVLEELLPPQWETIPDQSDRINTLDKTLDTSLYVTSNSGSLVLWRLSSAPAGFSINSGSGLVTATAAAGVGDHSLRVGVTNAEGESLSTPFTWQILEELLPPQWSTIPDRSDDSTDLPQDYDVSGYVTSNSGPLGTWSLISAPAGYSIDQSGVVTAGATSATGSITVRVYNDTGNASKTFTWTIIADDAEDFTEFNAVVGNWTHSRTGAAWGFDKDDVDHEVGTDVPVYEGCGWSGSAFTPDAGFLGIRLDMESTNYVLDNTDFTASRWVTKDASVGVDTYSPTGTAAHIYQVDADTGTADIVMSMYHKQEVAISGVIGIATGAAGTGNRLPFTPTPALQRFVSPYWASTSHLYPNMYSETATSGRLFAKYLQYELEGAEGATGPIKTAGSAVTRNQDNLTALNTDFGWASNACAQGFCGQVKIRSYFQKGISTWLQVYCLVSDASPNTQDYVSLWIRETDVRFAVYKGGSPVGRITSTVTLVDGGDYDIRFRVDPDVGTRLWVTGTGISDIDDEVNVTFADLLDTYHDMHKLGPWYETIQTGSGSYTFKSVRINRTVLTDAEIMAWT